MKVDTFDKAILNIIQHDNSLPLQEIGNRVGLSGPSVQRRIAKMKSNGVILSDVVIIDADSLGNFMTVFVEVELVDERMEFIDAIRNKFKKVPEIQQCYYVTGEMDFILVMVVPSMKVYEEITQQLFYHDPNIKRFKTRVSMDTIKRSLAVDL